MLEILQRVHDADAAERPAADLSGRDAEAADKSDDALSDDTIARLLEQVYRSFSISCGTCALSLMISQPPRSTY